jgi:hypothetical protein
MTYLTGDFRRGGSGALRIKRPRQTTGPKWRICARVARDSTFCDRRHILPAFL